MPQQTNRPNRRRFLQTTAATGVGFWVAGNTLADDSQSPNEKIRFACIGVGGKGSSDSEDAGKNGDVVAICDIDGKRLNSAAEKFPKAKKYSDYRKMLDEMGKDIDAVTVSTPDHSHAPASLLVMRMGKHCFCQKPLTHALYEARLMGKVAQDMKVATMMGNQGTAESGLRKAAALVQAGAIGDVSEVHVWTNRPIWPQGGSWPEDAKCPPYVNWDLFLGPARKRHYVKKIHPFAWRGWWDFGTGALGDMACHTMNMAFKACELRNPISVEAKDSGHNRQSYPKWSIINYEFPATDKRPAVKLTWYDGGKLPSSELLEGRKPSDSGSLLVGSKAKLFSPNDYGAEFEILGDVELPEVEFERSPGHFAEWVRAIEGGPKAMSNFTDYAGPLSETVLLGNLALWADGKVEWDAENLKATNAPELDALIHPHYRKGWTLEG